MYYENDRARHSRVRPIKWVAGDTVYGVGDIEQQLHRAGKGYVLGVSSARVFQSWGKRRARDPRPSGNACRQEPKNRDCMIGTFSNWPISRSKNLAAQIKVFGPAAY
jgi:SRSO17 transposase